MLLYSLFFVITMLPHSLQAAKLMPFYIYLNRTGVLTISLGKRNTPVTLFYKQYKAKTRFWHEFSMKNPYTACRITLSTAIKPVYFAVIATKDVKLQAKKQQTTNPLCAFQAAKSYFLRRNS